MTDEFLVSIILFAHYGGRMLFDISSSYGKGNIQALKTLYELSKIDISSKSEFCLDFSNFSENNPFNTLVIASFIRQLNKQYPNTSFKAKINYDNSFLAHLGFYNLMGIDYGKKIGEANPSNKYVPIKKLNLKAVSYNDIEERSSELAKLFQFDHSLEEFLFYAFFETIRNVYEHAETEQAFVCAQNWPSKNLIEVAIIDNGCGIANALGKRIKDKSEKELLYLSAKPGISAMSNHSYLSKDDYYRNSGYGLYALRKLCYQYGGDFLLCSGNYALLQTADKKVIEYDTFYPGTAISMKFKTNIKNDFKKIRGNIIKEGELEAKDTSEAIKRASKSSGGLYYRNN